MKNSGKPPKSRSNQPSSRQSSAETLSPYAYRHRDWVIPCAVAVVVCAALRLVDLIYSSEKLFLVDGHRVLATHDAYAWLAGADRVNYKSCSPVAVFLRILHTLTGVNLADIAFWLPLIMAPLVAVPISWLGARWRLSEGTVVAGVLAGAAPGFLFRTRLGYFDTDLFALFFPLLIGVVLCLWLEMQMRPPWGSGRRLSPGWSLLWPLGVGLISKLYLLLYPQGAVILMAILGTVAIFGLVAASSAWRFLLVLCLVIIVLVASSGWIGLASGACIVLIAFLKPRYYDWLTSQWVFLIGVSLIMGAAVFFISGVESWVTEALRKLAVYGGWVAPGPGDAFPAVIETVVEAKNADPRFILYATAGGWFLFAVGLCGYGFLIWRRPVSLLFLPLLLLALAGLRLGERFTMYGGAVIGLGLGFGLVQILQLLRGWPPIRLMCQGAVLLSFLFVSIVPLLGDKTPMTTATQDTIEALHDMRDKIAPASQFWIWWDYGYTAQYYARASTFSDGGHVRAEYAVPLARVYASGSPKDAFDLIAYAAGTARPVTDKCARLPSYENPFSGIFGRKDPGEVQAFLDEIADLPLPGEKRFPEQYLVLSWDNVKIAPTILRLGTGGISQGKGNLIPFEIHQDVLDFDKVRGTLTIRNQAVWLSGLTLITEAGIQHLDYGPASEFFAVIDSRKGITVLMGEKLYRSNLLQMLLGDPAAFDLYFELVLDRAPEVRVYKARL